jgi:hypothetical protein
MATKKATAVAAVTPVDYLSYTAPVKAWQFNTVEQLEADIKKSRLKSITFEASAEEVGSKSREVTRIRLADGKPVAVGEWIVYWPKDKFYNVFPDKFFKKHFRDAAEFDANQPTEEAPSEHPDEKSAAIVEPTLTIRNAPTQQEATLADDGETGQKIVLEEQEEVEAASNDTIGEIQTLSFVSAITSILDGEGGARPEKMKEIKALMKDLSVEQKHAIGARINKQYKRRILADGNDVEQAAPKKKPNERIPGRATANLIPPVIVNRRVSVLH